MYLKNYPKCSKCNHPMEIVYSKSWEGANPERPTQYGHTIKYRCLHCHNVEWENDGT